ncbi:MAG TPA: hypothetical protein VFL59_15570 [Candidatus Nanopelagicales bacterium]|nr:hypothetical protein [Candidatus Nanopelagicales bacterium]
MSYGEQPSKESLREVKREFKERRKAEQQQAKDAQAYWDQQSGRASKRGGRTAAIVGVTAAALVVAAGGAAAVVKVGPFAGTDAAARAGASGAPTSSTPAAPTASPTSAAPSATPSATAALPFAGSPAASWKPGFAGLVAPTAARVGIYRTAQVKAAYAMTVKYLSKALLDPGVTFKGEMSQVLTTLGPGFPAYAKQQHSTWVRTKGKKGFGYVDLANRFHPGDWVVLAPGRSKGRVGRATLKGQFVRVPFVFTTAYWVRPAKGGAPRAIAVRRSGYLQFEGYGPHNVWLRQWYSHYISSASVCGSDWKQPDYLEAWVDRAAVKGTAGGSDPSFDMTDPDAVEPGSCFTNTSGF